MVSAIQNRCALRVPHLVEFLEQRDAQGRARRDKEMRLNQTSGRQLPRGKRTDAFITKQLDELEAVVEAHGSMMADSVRHLIDL